MLCLITTATLVSVVMGKCFDVDEPNLKLKCGDLALNADFMTLNQLDAEKECFRIGGQLINLDSEEKWVAMQTCANEKWGKFRLETACWTGGKFKPNITDWSQLFLIDSPGALYWSNGKPINNSDKCLHIRTTEALKEMLHEFVIPEENTPIGVYASNPLFLIPTEKRCLNIQDADQGGFDYVCECINAP